MSFLTDLLRGQLRTQIAGLTICTDLTYQQRHVFPTLLFQFYKEIPLNACMVITLSLDPKLWHITLLRLTGSLRKDRAKP